MRLDNRLLEIHEPIQTGSDVDRLFDELSQLGAPYKDLLQKDVDTAGKKQFGEGAKRAVTAFQEANLQRLKSVVARSLNGIEDVRWSGIWGTVDPATAQLINEAVDRISKPFVIRGRVEFEDGRPVEGITVKVFDRDLGAERQGLGAHEGYVTNAAGVFQDVEYFLRDYAQAETLQGQSADLVFEVSKQSKPDGVELLAIHRQLSLAGRAAEEKVTDLVLGFPASQIETVRLVIREKSKADTSEYERLLAALQPLIEKVTPDQFNEERHRDITFAARETQENRDLIETLSKSWSLHKSTDLQTEVFYGLLRHGSPTKVEPLSADLPSLLAAGRAAWEAKLAEAFDLNIISIMMKKELPAWLETLTSLAGRAMLSSTSDAERVASLSEMLQLASIEVQQQNNFAEILARFEGTKDLFWKKVQTDLKWSPDQIQSAQTVLELAEITSSHKPLLTALYASVSSPNGRMIAAWDRTRLQDLISKSGVPAEYEAGNEKEKQQEFLNDIEDELKTRYPVEYLLKALKQTEDADLRKANAWLANLLSKSDTKDLPFFDILTTPVNAYLRENQDRLFSDMPDAEVAHYKAQLKRVQRVYQLSSTPEQVPLLFKEKLESAQQIAKWSHDHFVKQYADRLGGSDAASAVHSKAQYIHGTLLNLWIDILKAGRSANGNIPLPASMHPNAATSSTPSVNDIFGANDLCACTSCLSVLSPAAYFVDLLQFIDAPRPGEPTILQLLLARRPDLAHIQLTCENTNTRIPYVDLVNEILASYVAHEAPFPYNDPKDGISTGTAEELRANPILPTEAAAQAQADAFKKLASAIFPFNLPYNHWLEVVRLYLSHFGIQRETIMRRLQSDSDLDTEIAIAAEALKISPEEFEAITFSHFDGSSSGIVPTDTALYGFVDSAPPGTAPANHVSPEFASGDERSELIKPVQNFLKNISTSPGLTAAIRGAIVVNGQYDTHTADAVSAYRKDHALPAAGDTDSGFWAATASEGYGPLSLMMSYVPMFLRQTGIEYEDLIALVSSRMINGQFNGRIYFTSLEIRPEEIMSLIESKATTVPASIQAKLTAAGITPTAFLKRIAIFRNMLVLDSPPQGLCDLDQTTIRHMDGTLLTKAELVKFSQIIRLWKRLGWTLHEVDLVLSTFLLNDPFALILRLAEIKKLGDTLQIPIEQIISLWTNIDTWNEQSLFDRLFLSKTSQSLDPLFKLDGNRREIDAFDKSPASPPLLKDHIPLLLSALRITAPDLSLLLAAIGDPNLNLGNISALYRIVILAKVLDLPIEQFLTLTELSGLNPFKVPAGEIESAAATFVEAATQLAASGIEVDQLDYILRHRRSAKLTGLLSLGQKLDLLGALRSALEDIQLEDQAGDDPTGDVLARQLSAVLSSDVASTLSHMVYGSISYSLLLPGLPPATVFPAIVGSKLNYDVDHQSLLFRGVMTPAEKGALQAPGFIASLPAAVRMPFSQAIDGLFNVAEVFAKQNVFGLMESTELMTLVRSKSSLLNDGSIDLPAVMSKSSAILLRVRRLRSLTTVKRTLSDALQLEGPVIAALLEDSAVLIALNVPSPSIAVEDFLGTAGNGLDATYYANTSLTGPPAVSRADDSINYDGKAKPPAVLVGTPFSARWVGYLYASVTEDFTFVIRVRDGVRFWLNDALILDQWLAQPLNEFQVQVKLRKGSLNAIKVEYVHFAGDVNLQILWRSPSIDLAIIGADSLYTTSLLQSALSSLERLEKLATIINTLELTAPELSGISKLGYFDWNAVPVDEPAPATVTSLFDKWKTLEKFVAARNRISRKEGAFVALLESDSMDSALDQFSELTLTSKEDALLFIQIATQHPFDGTSLTYKDLPPKVQDIAWWGVLRDNFATAAKTGCSPAQIADWGKVKDVTRTAPAPPLTNWYSMSLDPVASAQSQKQAEDLKRLVKAKYDEATWRTVARPINDVLRKSDRDALVAYVMVMPAILEQHYKSSDELSEFFLLDPKMDPCMETSRIQLGISTIHLNLQNILMGANPEVGADEIDRQHYERMKTYALWQPSREIFIHPEKYIRWDLLDRKSKQFEEFEKDIRKQDLTQIDSPDRRGGLWAEEAFLNFLEKIDDVAKLEICGVFQDQTEGVLHVFGRTHNLPYRYFYRRSTQFLGTKGNTGQWTAWEQIPLDIDTIQDTGTESTHPLTDNDQGGVHLFPTTWNRRLYLIWPQFRLVPDDEFNSTIPKDFDRVNRWEIKLAWSELWNGAWKPKQVSASSISSRPIVVLPVPHTVPDIHDVHPGTTTVTVTIPYVAGGHYTYTYAVTTPTKIVNPLLPGDGVTISGAQDYVFFDRETTKTSVASYLPSPESHFFTLSELDGRLRVSGLVRYFGYTSGKERTIEKMSLTMRQDGKMTFREKTTDPVEVPISNPTSGYSDFGSFVMGACKVRDVESLSQDSPINYYIFRPPANSFNSFQGCKHLDPLVTHFGVRSPEIKVLNKTPYAFRVIGHEDVSGFQDFLPFFYQDRDRVYLVTPTHRQVKSKTTMGQQKSSHPAASSKDALQVITKGRVYIDPEFQFQLHCHPQICEFIRRLNRDGLLKLLSNDTQNLQDTAPTYFESQYKPTAYVAQPYPREDVEFSLNQAYSQYNWELFLYAPMRAWTELVKNLQFEEGELVQKTVVDVTSTAKSKPWQFLPFTKATPVRIQELLSLLFYTGTDPAKSAQKASVQTSIQEWIDDPFNPHLIARQRISAYMLRVLKDCCWHHIAAAKSEFMKYTMESLPLALQHLIIVIKVVRTNRPTPSPATGTKEPETFNSLRAKGLLTSFEDLSLAMADLETELPFMHSVPSSSSSMGVVSSVFDMYFCIPDDDEWGTIWDTVADLLFKIRHCMDIDGIVRQIPLFPDPIDPMLLVEARGLGHDVTSLSNGTLAAVPYFEFSVIFEKAIRLAEDVKAFEQRHSSLIERSEAEGVAEMRLEQESQWLKDYLRRELMESCKQQTALREAIESSRTAIQARIDYYDELISAGLLEDEKLQRSAMTEATEFQLMAQAAEVHASIVSLIPEVHAQGTASGTSFGGQELAAADRAFAGGFHAFSAVSSWKSSVAALNAQWQRRSREWTYLRTQASLDFKRSDRDLFAAQSSENMANLKLENSDKTAANTQAVLDFCRSRFLSAEKFQATADELYPDLCDLYQVAYSVARSAQSCCSFQFGLTDLNIIKFVGWNQPRKGMLAGEHLLLALKQLEKVYIDASAREFEIRRDVSLLELDPVAFIDLKQTGQCEFEIPESYFDADYPGHYMRRLRGASITIPCVIGRYTNINCELTLLKNKTRISSDVGTSYEEDLDQEDKRFVTSFASVQSIVTSHAQNDGGVFEPESRDGRYPPFRGAGAISRWRAILPIETNSFDRLSMTDVILTLPFTSRPGGDVLRSAAWKALASGLKDPTKPPRRKFFSARFESRDGWQRFLHPETTATSQSLAFDVSTEGISMLWKDQTIHVSAVSIYLNFKNRSKNVVYRSGATPLSGNLVHQEGTVISPKSTQSLISLEDVAGGTPMGVFPLTFDVNPGVVSTLKIDIPQANVAGISPKLLETIPGTASSRLRADYIDDMWFLLELTVG